MSKINDLIKQYCPDGVEWKELWELTIWDKKFVSVDKAKQLNIIKFNHVSAEILKNIKQNKNGNIRLLSTGIYSGYTTEDCIDNKKIINNAEVISLPSGGSVSLKYYNGSFIDSGNILAVSADTNKYCLKYIFYYLLNKKYLIELMYRGVGIQHPSMSEILQIKIPLPPLQIQQEIVNILDKFTELEAELEGRKKQYEHYRNTLLTFGDDVEWKELGEVCKFISSGSNKNRANSGLYPVYGSTGIIAKTDNYIYDKQQILIARVGANAGLVNIATGKYDVSDNTIIVNLKETINLKYVFYLLTNKNLNQFVKGGGQPLLTSTQIKKILIPVPPLPVQKKIVAILDKFDKLVNDIKEGLPAEIALRRKQYEFYRNKLLDFKDMEK